MSGRANPQPSAVLTSGGKKYIEGVSVYPATNWNSGSHPGIIVVWSAAKNGTWTGGSGKLLIKGYYPNN